MQLTRSLAGVVAVALLNACEGNAVVQVPPTPVIPQQSVAGTVPPSANNSATGFYDFMQSITWSKKTPVEMCVHSFWCFFGLSGKVNVDLDVPQGSYLVDPRAVPAGGVLLVRAINKGHDPTGHYHFRPGHIYAFEVHPNSPGDTLSHWILKETDTTTHLTVTVPGIQGPFSPCWDRKAATSDEVGLYKCGEAHTAAGLNTSAFGLFGFMDQLMAVVTSAMGSESPVWKSCPSGCCTFSTY